VSDGLARAVRELLAQADVGEPAVPVEQIAQLAGAVVSYQPFDSDDISGLLYRSADSAPVIGVNSSNSKVRQRFTIAHELGHLQLHKGRSLILERQMHVNFRDTTSARTSNQEEAEANRFAAELLMPQDLLEIALSALLAGRPLPDAAFVAKLANRFQVSRQAMAFRLASLGLLTPS
jgi:Zn-dependent peptidase ImmA (M78 family)